MWLSFWVKLEIVLTLKMVSILVCTHWAFCSLLCFVMVSSQGASSRQCSVPVLIGNSYLFSPLSTTCLIPQLCYVASLLLIFLSYPGAAPFFSTPLPIWAVPAQLDWIKPADYAKMSWMTLTGLMEIIHLRCIPYLQRACILTLQKLVCFWEPECSLA